MRSLERRRKRVHVVVTGASAGIGDAIAREFAAAGADLTLVARRKDKLDALARDAGKLGRRTHVVAADLSDVARACDWLAGAEEALGPVDVLVNNAGVQNIEPTEICDVEAGEQLLRLNVHTPMRLT